MKKIEEFKNKVICADCLDVMREMPDKSIDLCFDLSDKIKSMRYS